MRFGGSNLFSRSKRVIKEQETGRSAGRVFDFSFLDFSFPRPGTGNFDKAKRSEQRFEMIQEAEIIEESSDTIQEDETGIPRRSFIR